MADIEVTDVPAVRAAVVRKRGRVYEIMRDLKALYGRLAQAGVPLADAPAIGIFYDDAGEFDPNDAAYEVCVPVSADAGPTGDIDVRDLPAIRAATAVHRGSYRTISSLYEAMFRWLRANGHALAGPVREVYVAALGRGAATQDDCVTEVQLPVSRA